MESENLPQHNGRQGEPVVESTEWPPSELMIRAKRDDADGRSKYTSEWNDSKKGLAKAAHPSFDYDTEDETFFSIEAHPAYENENPRTVTTEGFGLECWDYEERHGRPRNRTVLCSGAAMGGVPAQKLLRRVSELRNPRQLGVDPVKDDIDLIEFIGRTALVGAEFGSKHEKWLVPLIQTLNRKDVFIDFSEDTRVAQFLFAQEKEYNIWSFLNQIILAKELARRLENVGGLVFNELTAQIIASMTLADLFIQNVDIVLEDSHVDTSSLYRPLSDDQRAKAEALKAGGNVAMQNKNWQLAEQLYFQAIEINPASPIYRNNHSGAYTSLGKFWEAAGQAYMATQLDPNYAKAWARLGFAQLKIGYAKQARKSYQRAIEIAGSNASGPIRQGLADSRKTIEGNRQRAERGYAFSKELLDQDFDINMKAYKVQSRIHKQQEEGLVFFA
ncbi:hypothetical protein BJY04DRAFT_212668 [Aspergillus karnatakaensis]|uniref:tetratricopeptide repeat protein n=1 Tax=Aspergillus karnatakaensis TaxID=1810916 RepID=UPI003CCD7850